MSKTVVRIEKVYADGSGAPATVICSGYYFAAEFVGEARLTGLTGRLHPDINADWYDANRAMYAKEVAS